jgi:opacity protein-like surface antigen
MKSRLSLLVAGLALVLISVVQAAAADVSGKWTADVPGRNGQTREQTFTFKVDGEKLTGTVSGMQGAENAIADGKVSGTDISFSVSMSMNGNDIKLSYKGAIAGDEIKFTRSREGSDQKQEFTAKRVKSST